MMILSLKLGVIIYLTCIMKTKLKIISIFSIFFSLIALSLFSGKITSIAQAKTNQEQEKTIYFFYGQGCPHCVQVENFFDENKLWEKYPIEKKEIYFERKNAVLFNQIMEKRGVPQDKRGVPTVVIGDKVLTGDSLITTNFETAADKYLSNTEKKEQKNSDVQPSKLTALAVITASLVDAVNPCAFAVLIILMTTILLNDKKKRTLKAGFAFSAAIFISYLLMGLGVYSALSWGGISRVFYTIIGWAAIILGLFNLKDFFWYGKGFLMEVPLSWRPKLKKVLKSVTSPLGAFLIGFVVSLILLPCTSGPYLVILGMLAQKETLTRALIYLILYNLIFVSPMVIISVLVSKGYNPKNAEMIRQKHLKNLHLIAGILMLGVGIMILLN